MTAADELLTGFNCVADSSAKILILGSMPGTKSIQEQQYYAHPRNAFWKIIEAIYQIPHDADYQQRLESLKQHKIALWDVVHQCVRPGSLDADIQSSSVQANDFKALFEFSPDISRIYFNGAKAGQLYRTKVLSAGIEHEEILEYVQLPSTSPANAAMTFSQKLDQWRQICS